MEQTQRIALYAALLIVALFLWNAWNREHPIETNVTPMPTAQTSPTIGGQPQQPGVPPISAQTNVAVAKTSQFSPPEKLIKVQTDVINVAIDPLGGNIVSVGLPKYPAKLNTPNEPYRLLSSAPENLYIAESALMGVNGPDSSSVLASYQSPQTTYFLDPKQNQLQVTLTWKNEQGLEVKKTYTFERGSYLIQVAYTISNAGKTAWSGNLYTQISRKELKSESETHYLGIHTFTGAAISSPEKRYHEISFNEMQKTLIQQTISNGWAAMVQRYFLSAWIPNPQQPYNYYSKVSADGIFTIGMSSPTIQIVPGEVKTIAAKFYAGPEVASLLKPIAPGLDLTISYGWLTVISVIIFWIMEKIYRVVGNWGWSIILITLLIKAMFYHLSAKSYTSMAKMRELQPKILALRERFKEDKQKLGQATMELYKKEKVNPLGGCLPIAVQIPVFFALYMVLIESVELRQAPWILWIKDLSAPDPLFILPVIMGITMFLQQKLNPPPPDPTQAKIMMFLPVIFTVLFIYFPAGLVLYWVVNNVLSVAQQWYIMQKHEKAHGKSKN